MSWICKVITDKGNVLETRRFDSRDLCIWWLFENRHLVNDVIDWNINNNPKIVIECDDPEIPVE